jgi:hypothetical protein
MAKAVGIDLGTTNSVIAGPVLAAALIDTSVLEQTLQRPVDSTEYLTLAWIISSLATVGGAIGSRLAGREYGAGRRLRPPSRTRRPAAGLGGRVAPPRAG